VLTAAVVIPCYTEDRWSSILEAVGSALGQTYPSDVVVVVDHNPALAVRLRAEVDAPVTVLENGFAQGVSGARNTGAFAVGTDLVAFLDDDTTADPTWLERLVEAYASAPAAVGAGGAIQPVWGAHAPSWLPQEFLWTVGATPPDRRLGPVRNVWGGNMLVERSAFVEVGGFCDTFGKLGDVAQPEDTELCLRLSAHEGVRLGWMFAPKAVVRHNVGSYSSTWAYFVRRCWSEGAGKAALASRSEHGVNSLDAESAFIRFVLTRGLARAAGARARGDRTAVGQALAILLGTASAGAGFLTTRLRWRHDAVERTAATVVVADVIPAPRTDSCPMTPAHQPTVTTSDYVVPVQRKVELR
jgi:GT2 family glycosyltransferase